MSAVAAFFVYIYLYTYMTHYRIYGYHYLHEPITLRESNHPVNQYEDDHHQRNHHLTQGFTDFQFLPIGEGEKIDTALIVA